MPLHVGLLGSAGTHGHALGKKCVEREQHPVASRSSIYRARHVLPVTVQIAGTPPSLVAKSSPDCLRARLQPLRPGGLARQPDSRTGAPAGSVQQLPGSAVAALAGRPRRPLYCGGEALRMHGAQAPKGSGQERDGPDAVIAPHLLCGRLACPATSATLLHRGLAHRQLSRPEARCARDAGREERHTQQQPGTLQIRSWGN